MRILAIGTNGKLVAGGAVSQGSRNIITDIPECGRIEFGEEFSIAEGDIRVERSFANDLIRIPELGLDPIVKVPSGDRNGTAILTNDIRSDSVTVAIDSDVSRDVSGGETQGVQKFMESYRIEI